jgi:REP element-mobilizing transposase RayT
MARISRLRICEEEGSYHIISRILGKKGEDFLMDEEGKSYLLFLLKLCCSAFFVELHSFCILDNHFHLLVSEQQSLAESATAEQLMKRYRILKGCNFQHQLSEDEVTAKLQIESLRARFGDISRFVQEIKQCFGRWYNKKHDRRGTLWSDRFKSILVSKGQAQVDVAAYIELNPVRAGIVSRPEDYKWCSLGQQAQAQDKNNEFVSFIHTVEHENDLSFEDFVYYVHEMGGISVADCDRETQSQQEKNGSESEETSYSVRQGSFSNGIVIGSRIFVEKVQEFLGRVFIRGRNLLTHKEIYGSRRFCSL